MINEKNRVQSQKKSGVKKKVPGCPPGHCQKIFRRHLENLNLVKLLLYHLPFFINIIILKSSAEVSFQLIKMNDINLHNHNDMTFIIGRQCWGDCEGDGGVRQGEDEQQHHQPAHVTEGGGDQGPDPPANLREQLPGPARTSAAAVSLHGLPALEIY